MRRDIGCPPLVVDAAKSTPGFAEDAKKKLRARWV